MKTEPIPVEPAMPEFGLFEGLLFRDPRIALSVLYGRAPFCEEYGSDGYFANTKPNRTHPSGLRHVQVPTLHKRQKPKGMGNAGL